MKIAVICGGNSSEREVSLKTGEAVYNALAASYSDVYCLECKDESDCIEKIMNSKPDIVFIALHGGFGENGQLQATLDMLKIKYTGCGFTQSSLAMDKFATKSILKAFNIPTAMFKLIKKPEDIEDIDYYPVCIKPNNEGSSVGVEFAENKKEAKAVAEKLLKNHYPLIAEKKLNGKELTVGIIGDTVLPVIWIKPKNGFYDYHNKYTKGATEYIIPSQLPQKIENLVQTIAYNAYKAIGCNSYARVDIILENNIPYVLEINTIPGMTQTSLLPKAALAKGISFEKLTKMLVEAAC